MVRFGAENPANVLAEMSDEEIDDLAFGAIEVDGRGQILRYNAAEGDISGRTPSEMIGRNFFKDVAPCTDTADFEGRFRKGVETGGDFDVRLTYTFDYDMEPTHVQVRMQSSPQPDEYWKTYWILVKRL